MPALRAGTIIMRINYAYILLLLSKVALSSEALFALFFKISVSEDLMSSSNLSKSSMVFAFSLSSPVAARRSCFARKLFRSFIIFTGCMFIGCILLNSTIFIGWW